MWTFNNGGIVYEDTFYESFNDLPEGHTYKEKVIEKTVLQTEDIVKQWDDNTVKKIENLVNCFK